ncbi:MAG: disulfide bond formation protein B [Pseudomonadota bacterium]
MTRQRWIGLAGLGSALLLGAAFFFQALGWAPCAMCLWQRWPHAAAVAVAALGLALPFKALALAGAASTATSAGIAAFHSGVELKWWDGPASCTSSGQTLFGLDGDALVPGSSDVPVLVLCDTLTPFFLGLTMANWNLIASLALTVAWLVAVTRAAA